MVCQREEQTAGLVVELFVGAAKHNGGTFQMRRIRVLVFLVATGLASRPIHSQSQTCAQIAASMSKITAQRNQLLATTKGLDPHNPELRELESEIASLNKQLDALQQQWASSNCQPSPPKITPSDVFFADAAHPDSKPGTSFGPLNTKPASSIVARDAILRGWIVAVEDGGGAIVSPNISPTGIGIEDVHYSIVLDPDFITQKYGTQPNPLPGAWLPGNPSEGATGILLTSSPPGSSFNGITVNSFWNPGIVQTPIVMPIELNAWHMKGSARCGLGGLFCFLYNNYTGRGPAPAGWIHKEYGNPGPEAADSWWPFDPDSPDGTPLNLGDYVEVQGTLWEDTAHEDQPAQDCWSRAFPGHGGRLEIHPLDTLKHVQAPSAMPTRMVVPVSVCMPNQSGDDRTFPAIHVRVCPEGTSSLSQPRPGPPSNKIVQFQELVDPRFTDASSTTGDATPAGDCLQINRAPKTTTARGGPKQGLIDVVSGRFKATYIVWWTP